MAGLRILNYDPSEPGRAKKIPPEVWESHRERIVRYWIFEEQTLPQLMDTMRCEQGFVASEAQYRQKFKTWELHKNVPAKAMKSAARVLYDDPRREKFADGLLELAEERFTAFRQQHPNFGPATSLTASISSHLTGITRAGETSVLLSAYNRKDVAFLEELTSRRSQSTILICCQCHHFGVAALSSGRCTICSHFTCDTCKFEVHISPRIRKNHRHQLLSEWQSDSAIEMNLKAVGEGFFEAKSVIDAELSAIMMSSQGVESEQTVLSSTMHLK